MKTRNYSLLIALLCVFNLSAKDIYLNTGGSALWNQADAKFATWTWKGSGDGSFSQFMTLVSGDIYTTTIADDVDHIIFVRLNSATTAPSWDAKWNQTADLTIDGNLYTITGWNDGDGTWGNYDGQGSTNPGDDPDKPNDPSDDADNKKHDFYLTGYIEGAEEEYNIYSDGRKFVDGKLEFNFTKDAYVTLKDKEGNFYMSKEAHPYDAEGPSVTFYWTDGTWTNCYKWHIPAGKQYIIMESKSIWKNVIYLQIVDKATYDAYSLSGSVVDALQNVEATAYKIVGNTVVTDGNLIIYNIAGQEVTGQNGNLRGLYIISIDGQKHKVIIN